MKLATQTHMQDRLQAWCPSAHSVVVRTAHAALGASLFADAITREVGVKPRPSGFKRGNP